MTPAAEITCLRAALERILAVPPGDRDAALEALAYVRETARLALSENRKPAARTAPETALASTS